MTKKKKDTKVNEIIKAVHDFAPPGLALEWDNSGFLLGDASSDVHKILLCLDITDLSVDYAVQMGADLIISHHPLIFRPIKKITNPLYIKLIKNSISVICAHTNLDITEGGVNHKLASLLQLKDLEILSANTNSSYRVEVNIPSNHLESVKTAVFAAGAGKVGNYTHCASESVVSGQFIPGPGSNPTAGEYNQLHKTDLTRLGFMVERHLLYKVLKALERAHPYQTPAYSVFEQKQISNNNGLGLIGTLASPVSLENMAQNCKQLLGSASLKLWLAGKSASTKVSRIAVCGGSGSSLISQASNRADLFISGEFGYHAMLDSPLPLIEAGHFFTEFPVLEVLKELLSSLRVETEIMPRHLHETRQKMRYF